jgi:hypothetical protein
MASSDASSQFDNTIACLYQSWQNAPSKRDDTLKWAEQLLRWHRGTADEGRIQRFLNWAGHPIPGQEKRVLDRIPPGFVVAPSEDADAIEGQI